jgi:hypothetical protein
MYKSEDNGSYDRCRITNIGDKITIRKRKTRFPKEFHLFDVGVCQTAKAQIVPVEQATHTKLTSQTTVVLNVLYPFISANSSNSHS